jgi:hypothetical protein
MKTREFINLIITFLLIITLYNPQILAGEHKKDNDPRINIVGGMDADIKDYPWQISIFSLDESGNLLSHSCGGSIIDPYWIVTAAHCIRDKAYKRQKIIAEITDLSRAYYGQVMEITDYIIHPDYNPDSITNDIALLRLSMPIDTSGHGASVIKMVTPQDEINGIIAPGVIATITGWGTTEYMGDSPDRLQVAELPIISIETANQWFHEASSDVTEVKEGMLPAGFEEGGVSSCHGDSGGPLVVKDNENEWNLAGITSWGDVCGEAKQPAIYTRIPYYYNWVIENTRIGLGENPIEPDFADILKLDVNKNVYLCEDIFYFGDILIQNFGTNELENCKLIFKIGNSPDEIIMTDSITVNFEPALPPKGTKRINLPEIIPEEYGNYYIEATLREPNGNISAPNDLISGNFSFNAPAELNLSFDLGQIQGIEWEIYDNYSFSEPLKSGTYDTSNSNSEFTENFCLPEGEYYFSFFGQGEGNCQLNLNYDGRNFLLYDNETTGYGWTFFEIPFVPEYDLDIHSASDLTSDSIFICESSPVDYDIEIQIFNNGTLIADSILLRIDVNGNITDTLLNTKLFSYNTEYLYIETDMLEIGKNTINVEILSYSAGAVDKNPADNSFKLEVYFVEAPQIGTLEVRPDENYWNYDWRILNSIDEVVMYNRYYYFDTYFTDICLPYGCYKFETNFLYNTG